MTIAKRCEQTSYLAYEMAKSNFSIDAQNRNFLGLINADESM